MSIAAKAQTPPPPATATLTRRGSLCFKPRPTRVGGIAVIFGAKRESQSFAGP